MTEFDDVIRILRENRPEATPLELDQIKQRVRRSAAQPSRRSQDMKSRLAILAMLVLGMMLSTTGAGLAIQGLSQSNDASVAQYGDDDDDAGDILGERDSGGPAPDRDDTPPGDVAGEDDTSTPVQPARQVETGSDGGELPFTGFLALPVLIGGIALLSAGLVLRRRTRD
jgi:hypothetical protein